MSGHGVTDQDIPWLVHGVKRLREQTYGCGKWDDAGIVAAVSGMRGWNFPTAVEQILRRATDPEARTPKALLHKVSSAVLPSEKRTQGGPPKRTEECPVHIGQPRPPFCGPCNTDDLGPAPEPVAGELTGPAAARAALGLSPKADA